MDKIIKITRKELIELLDNMNKDEFKYVGLIHARSGQRERVEAHKEFIQDLKAKPVSEYRLKGKIPDDFARNFIIIDISDYVNIYRVEDVKSRFGDISKKKCVVILQGGYDEANI